MRTAAKATIQPHGVVSDVSVPGAGSVVVDETPVPLGRVEGVGADVGTTTLGGTVVGGAVVGGIDVGGSVTCVVVGWSGAVVGGASVVGGSVTGGRALSGTVVVGVADGGGRVDTGGFGTPVVGAASEGVDVELAEGRRDPKSVPHAENAAAAARTSNTLDNLPGWSRPHLMRVLTT
jgi:hypothetical protein